MKWPLYHHFHSYKLRFPNNRTIIPLQKCQPKFLNALEKVWIKKLNTLIVEASAVSTDGITHQYVMAVGYSVSSLLTFLNIFYCSAS